MIGPRKLLLDHLYAHEKAQAGRVFLTQPLAGGTVVNHTWGQVMDQARRMATHLRGEFAARGLAPGARVAILSKNCAQFIMAEIAIWMAGGTTVAIFPTETAETVNYVLTHSEASLLFVGKLDGWAQQRPGVPAGLPCVAFDLAPAGHGLPTWSSITQGTAPLAGEPARAPQDLAVLMYTSGSTGTPKGVMHSFERFSAAAEGIQAYLRSQIGQDADCRVLSYLPLSHIFERAWIESAALVDGRTHIFFAEALDTFLADLQRARPTLFISVPRLWLKFQQGVFAKMPAAKLDRLLKIPLLGRLVARKVRAGLGLDQVLMAGSGSAPIPPDLIAWYRRIGLPLYEGYGMTEDCAYSFTSKEGHNAPGYVGVALAGVQAKLSPEGEILIKSPGQLVGYYKRPDLDAESFTADGFFRTGDLGAFNAQGLLQLTGRAKELFKTAKGKYVAPAPIENRLNAHPMVELSLVSGVGQSMAFGVVLLHETLRPRQHEPALRAEVGAQLAQLLDRVNASLAEHERLQMLVVAREPWSIENGCLTPTMKIRRNRIEKLLQPELERWYADRQKVLWQ
ncbi:AMP-binding protein [Ideonella livida]|uniref:AMP-binding protein n=1 Tax=Ideonella livida TaxID=2707176 RepID=A0A7C9TI38_9BURK|nr:AMP-binding protein [Ideonella livida]NDY91059.1 AMP-binding protein [Ideonella livida]